MDSHTTAGTGPVNSTFYIPNNQTSAIQSGKQMSNHLIPSNQILYGPPGTGKTYHTINKALEILDPDFLQRNIDKRAELKARFDFFADQKQIHFVTFHQSFSYEDFVEGLKAKTDNGTISYFVEPGVFLRACEAALKEKGTPSLDEILNQFKEEISESPEELKTPTGKTFTVRYNGGTRLSGKRL